MTLDMEVTQPWKTGSRQRFGKGVMKHVSVGPQDLSRVDRNRKRRLCSSIRGTRYAKGCCEAVMKHSNRVEEKLPGTQRYTLLALLCLQGMSSLAFESKRLRN